MRKGGRPSYCKKLINGSSIASIPSLFSPIIPPPPPLRRLVTLPQPSDLRLLLLWSSLASELEHRRMKPRKETLVCSIASSKTTATTHQAGGERRSRSESSWSMNRWLQSSMNAELEIGSRMSGFNCRLTFA